MFFFSYQWLRFYGFFFIIQVCNFYQVIAVYLQKENVDFLKKKNLKLDFKVMQKFTFKLHGSSKREIQFMFM
jgi:hypothetical protein